MNSSKHEQAVAELNSSDRTTCLSALRFIKNNVIGNKTKKDLYIQLNVIPKLVKFLRSEADTQVKIQSVIILGSFAYGGEENVMDLVRHNAIRPLLDCISLKNDPKLIEAAVRALKAAYKSPAADKSDVFHDDYLRDIIVLLNLDSLNPKTDREKIMAIHIAEVAATIIARCCDTVEQQLQIARAGAPSALIKLLTCGYSKAQEAALDALAFLCRENPMFGKAIVEIKTDTGGSPVDIMLKLIRDKSPMMRLIASRCLTHLNRCKAIEEYSDDIKLGVLPTLVKLLDEKGPVQEEAPHVLAYLIRDNESLQKAACDAEAITKLAQIITQIGNEERQYYDSADSDKLKENALTALAAMSSLTDAGRKLVVEANIVTQIVQAMSHRSYGVRAAACQCTRSLSRSVNILRTSLIDAGVAGPLFKLLSDESTDVQTIACATLCNMVLEFAPMKKTVVEMGGIEKFVELLRSSDNALRLNAIWALKNLVCSAESDIKESVMKILTYPTMASLIDDPEIDIQEQAITLLRNLACKRPVDIEEVFKGLGENQLMDIIENKLLRYEAKEEIIMQILYVITNIASGDERHKQSIMSRSSILQSILKYMSHDNPEIRVAAVWCLNNLTHPEDKQIIGTQERIRRLRQMGFEEKIKNMAEDGHLDVRERVKQAMSQFSQV
ncbi:8803_t:CDS:10 [Paraglomus occultum]|uniref:8803_t:CDS:1 n=1 Tax=Paraglomus occultum TaxID=144539 RepID=A0A9N8ZMH0_9GLOM|nr:8803_t:CDS:10 [Paraglomus occultum]